MNIYQGYIKANGGDTPRRADQIVYTVVIDYGGKAGPMEFANVTPSGQRPDPNQVDSIPRPVGYPFLATESVPGMPAMIHFEETPAYGPCTPPALRAMLGNVQGGALKAKPPLPAPI